MNEGNKEFNKPVKVFRSRSVQASIWENKGNEDKTFLSVTFVKSWKDKVTEAWKNGPNFNKQDLGDLIIVNQLVVQYMNKGE